MVFANQIHVLHENPDFRFSVWLIHSMESMDSMESMVGFSKLIFAGHHSPSPFANS